VHSWRVTSVWKISNESDGLTWTPQNGGTLHFYDGALMMKFDPAERLMYAASWGAGIWR
jgi:hypothetical protein